MFLIVSSATPFTKTVASGAAGEGGADICRLVGIVGGVGASPAVQCILAELAHQEIVAGAAEQDVVAARPRAQPGDDRCRRPRAEVAIERVVAVAAFDDVVAAVERAAAGETLDGVDVAGYHVAALVAEDMVVAAGELDRDDSARADVAEWPVIADLHDVAGNDVGVFAAMDGVGAARQVLLGQERIAGDEVVAAAAVDGVGAADRRAVLLEKGVAGDVFVEKGIVGAGDHIIAAHDVAGVVPGIADENFVSA